MIKLKINKHKIGALAMTGLIVSSSLSQSLVLASSEQLNPEQVNNTILTEDNSVIPDKSMTMSDRNMTSFGDEFSPRFNLANFYVDLPESGAYNGRGILSIRPFSYEGSSNKEEKLYDLYIVMPRGLSIDGGLEALETSYNQYLSVHPMISSNPTMEFLGNTLDGRETYKITTNGTSTSPAQEFMDLPIKITGDTSITEIHSNAGIQESNKDYGVVYAGINDDSELNEIKFYPHTNATDTILSQVGVNNIQVATIVGDMFVRTMTLFKAKTLDTYILKEKNTGEILGTKEIQGESGDSYSRVGLIDKASLWSELDTVQYDINTYSIQEGEELTGDAIFSPEGTLGGDPDTIYPGHTYELYINKFAEDITVHYQDEEGNSLDKDHILSGHIGEEYTTEPKEFGGYTLKEIQGNASGTFTDQSQEVIYVYERTDAAPVTVKYQDEEGNDLSPAETLNGKIGLPYESQPKSINGWNVKATPSNASGTFSDKPQEVVYVYERTEAAPVTVKYQDEEGNDLSPAETLNGKIGLPYESQPKSINGWTVKTTPSNASGTFSDKPQEVVYVYTRITEGHTVNNDNSVKPEHPNQSVNPSHIENNMHDNELPSTGESKGLFFSIIGGFLTVVAGVTLLLRRKTK
ncbi:MucBP domain-containing protein [Lactococcus garvieae]|uniref:MucBP domain-containing protein n=1 Tax=Lactococcus garvieae TaxID=1363 RepID=UPI0038535F0A